MLERRAALVGAKVTSCKCLGADRDFSKRRFLMLTSQKIIDAINEQIGAEFSAMLQYVAIAAHFSAEALPELAGHFAKQAEEEKEHAHRFAKFVVDTGARVEIPAVTAPQSNFNAAAD